MKDKGEAMKTLYFFGASTEEKRHLLMYLANILSVESTVVLITDETFMLGALQQVNYNDNFVLQKHGVDADVDVDYLLVDQSQPIVTEESEHRSSLKDAVTYFVVNPKRSVVEDSEPLTAHISDSTTVIIQNLLFDTTISSKYLMRRLKISNKQKLYEVYLNDRDMCIQTENEYNESLAMRHLSSSYKKLLLNLLTDLDADYKKTGKQLLKQAIKRG